MSPYILLGFFIAGLLHAFVSRSAMSRHLAGNGIGPVVKAALMGIPLPLCSCGVLPTAISLRRNGASRGATTSFLIATPQTGVDSIAATWSLLGLPFAIIRPVAALVGSVFGGVWVDRTARGGEDIAVNDCGDADLRPQGFGARMLEALRYGMIDMVGSVGRWLVIGLVVAALITVFVPDSLFVGLSDYPLLAMLAVVVVAVPMYICATGSIPIALSLMLKGLSPGIAFVMLMAGPAANFASIVLLSRTQGRKATAIYVATVVITAIAFGLIIDLLLPAGWFVPAGVVASHGCHAGFELFPTLCSGVLVALLIYSAVRNHRKDNVNTITDTDMNTATYKIDGMACNHCRANVEKALSALEGVEGVDVDLAAGRATVSGDVKPETVVEAVTRAGYECRPE